MNFDEDALPGNSGTDRNARPAAELHCREVPAEAERFSTLRRALSGWVAQVGMNEEQTEMVALATYEALANVTEHAYPQGGGMLALHALHWAVSGQVEVVVTDHGRWQEPSSDQGELGGRGLTLIENLAERAEVTSTAAGTSVRMVWSLTPRAEPACADLGAPARN